MSVLKVGISLFFEAESLLHMGTNIKKKKNHKKQHLYWQASRSKPLEGARLYGF